MLLNLGHGGPIEGVRTWMRERQQNNDPVDGGGFDFGVGIDRTSASSFMLFQHRGRQALAM